jgi:hypothetical protein
VTGGGLLLLPPPPPQAVIERLSPIEKQVAALRLKLIMPMLQFFQVFCLPWSSLQDCLGVSVSVLFELPIWRMIPLPASRRKWNFTRKRQMYWF